MEYIVISITALFVVSLALFSGFGLGTILMPAQFEDVIELNGNGDNQWAHGGEK